MAVNKKIAVADKRTSADVTDFRKYYKQIAYDTLEDIAGDHQSGSRLDAALLLLELTGERSQR